MKNPTFPNKSQQEIAEEMFKCTKYYDDVSSVKEDSRNNPPNIKHHSQGSLFNSKKGGFFNVKEHLKNIPLEEQITQLENLIHQFHSIITTMGKELQEVKQQLSLHIYDREDHVSSIFRTPFCGSVKTASSGPGEKIPLPGIKE